MEYAEEPENVEDVRVECQRPTGDVAASVRRGLVLVVMHVAIASYTTVQTHFYEVYKKCVATLL